MSHATIEPTSFHTTTAAQRQTTMPLALAQGRENLVIYEGPTKRSIQETQKCECSDIKSQLVQMLPLLTDIRNTQLNNTNITSVVLDIVLGSTMPSNGKLEINVQIFKCQFFLDLLNELNAAIKNYTSKNERLFAFLHFH